jgi:hypothetical protein
MNGRDQFRDVGVGGKTVLLRELSAGREYVRAPLLLDTSQPHPPPSSASILFYRRPAHADGRKTPESHEKLLELLRLYVSYCKVIDTVSLTVSLEAAYSGRVWRSRREAESPCDLDVSSVQDTGSGQDRMGRAPIYCDSMTQHDEKNEDPGLCSVGLNSGRDTGYIDL